MKLKTLIALLFPFALLSACGDKDAEDSGGEEEHDHDHDDDDHDD